jgi:dUTP pyrophosphatase
MDPILEEIGMINVRWRKLHPDAKEPGYYQYPGDSGFDFHALEDGEIRHQEMAVVRTGLAFELPKTCIVYSEHGDRITFSFELQIRPRSGLAAREGIMTVLGTIDHSYRGEVALIMTRLIPGVYHYSKGDRLAQGVLTPIPFPLYVSFQEVRELNDTLRGAGGIGSTGR